MELGIGSKCFWAGYKCAVVGEIPGSWVVLPQFSDNRSSSTAFVVRKQHPLLQPCVEESFQIGDIVASIYGNHEGRIIGFEELDGPKRLITRSLCTNDRIRYSYRPEELKLVARANGQVGRPAAE